MKYSHLVETFDHHHIHVLEFKNSPHPNQTCVFLHGLGGDAFATYPTIKLVLDQIPSLRCLSYDLRGHGLSTKTFPTSVSNFETVGALDLQTICHYFKLTDPVFIGHSAGGIIVQHYLHQKLKPVPKYIFLGNTPPHTPPLPIPRSHWFHLLQHSNFATNPKQKYRTLSHHLHYKYTFDLNPLRLYQDFTYSGIRSLCLIYLSVFGWSNPNLQSLNHPKVTIIFGTKDITYPTSYAKKTAQKLPKANIFFLPSYHHQLFSAFPLEVASLIKQKLSS